MEFKYEWRILTDDGLVKQPPATGGQYRDESPNGVDDYNMGYFSESDAIEGLRKFKTENPGYYYDGKFMLVKILQE